VLAPGGLVAVWTSAPGAFSQAEPPQGEQPHGEVVEALPVAVARLADADAARAAEDPLDLRNQPFGFIEPALVTEDRYRNT